MSFELTIGEAKSFIFKSGEPSRTRTCDPLVKSSRVGCPLRISSSSLVGKREVYIPPRSYCVATYRAVCRQRCCQRRNACHFVAVRSNRQCGEFQPALELSTYPPAPHHPPD